MVSFLSMVKPTPAYTMSLLAPCRRQLSLHSTQFSLPRTGFSPFKRILQACLQSNRASWDAGVQLPEQQPELIFLGTGTSEGIPRGICLTNPTKKCQVFLPQCA